MRFNKTVLTAGFAMFSMFFGSGNLVFPLVVGLETLDQSPYAIIGLLTTGVVVPFLGLIGVILYSGNRTNFFACIGKIPAFLLTFAMLALMGPIGVIPRCILVAYGGATLVIPNLSSILFSIIFCLITLLLVWKHERIIPIIGRILTPWLLLSIVVLITAGLIWGPSFTESKLSSFQAFSFGLNRGYQTMDLLAAFFFSATTVAYIRSRLHSDDPPRILYRLSLNSSLIGAGLLAGIYLSFALLGARYAPQLMEISPAQMLVGIAGHSLGKLAIPIASLTISLACLTTATILVMLFADFLHEDICKKKINNHLTIIITLIISFFVSLKGFDSLVVWIGTILQVAYPALIALTGANIINKIWHVKFSAWAFWITLFATLFINYFI